MRHRSAALSRSIAVVAAAAGVAALAVAPARATAQVATAAQPILTAPKVTVLRNNHELSPGYVFTGLHQQGSVSGAATIGPEISDNYGRPVWYHNVPAGYAPTDVRVQSYQGKPVITYWVGKMVGGLGYGEGTGYIVDQHYTVIARVHAGDGYAADLHEFRLTPQGTALVTGYHQTTVDTSAIGGPKDQKVLDAAVQEIDVRTGQVLLDWHSLNHIPIADSHQPLPASADTPWDYTHLNGAAVDTDGNLIISSRHTWTLYKVNRHTGNVIWELGGRHSTFQLGAGVQFTWQHDPEVQGNGVYRIFDNEAKGSTTGTHSRVVTVQVNTQTKQATLVKSVPHPDLVSADSQGNSQLLPDGNLFVGWGSARHISEFDSNGNMIFDETTPAGLVSYRAYRYDWDGMPTTKPTLRLSQGADGPQFDMIWNGATKVVRWVLLGGTSTSSMTPYLRVGWNGLDTAVVATDPPAYVQALAMDRDGNLLGKSTILRTGAS